jgi:selenide,water dikinase
VTTGGARRNERYVTALVHCAPGVSPLTTALVVDPQTSGGLLLAVPPERAADYLARVEGSALVGEVLPHGPHALLMV